MRLVDAQQMHADHPATFDVPDPEELQAIHEGDYVKVGFEDLAERMWVLVRRCDGDTITGTLANTPLGDGIEYGGLVSLERRHVYAIASA
jgi:hypothetical protein